MVLLTDVTTAEREIADLMVAHLLTIPELNQPEIHIDNPVDLARAVKDMAAGHLLIDVFPVGISQEKKNRRVDEYTYEIHVGVRAKVETITKPVLNVMSYYRNRAQRAFGARFRLELPETGTSAHLIQSEPFAPYGREALHREGVFLAPISFLWKCLE